MANLEIRTALMNTGMRQWELAELLNISEFNLSRKFRKELPEEEKERIQEHSSDTAGSVHCIRGMAVHPQAHRDMEHSGVWRGQQGWQYEECAGRRTDDMQHRPFYR